MKNLSLIIILFCFYFSSCKKSTDPPHVQNSNVLTASIKIPGRDTRTLSATGDNTFFSIRIDELFDDTVMNIQGGDSVGLVQLILINIHSEGTYPLEPADTLGTNSSVLDYREGGFYPTLLYSTGWASSTGSYTITKINNDDIEGTFNATIKNDSVSNFIVESGTFKGKLEH